MSVHALSCHPDTPSTAIERLEVELERDEHGAVRLTYRMIGDARRVLAPTSDEPPRRRDELWRHTCCELFVRDDAGPGYRELDFAPCGDWAAYRFSGYRAGRVPLEASPPRVELERSPAAITLAVVLADEAFGAHEAVLRIGVACIVETATELSYWALAHAPGPPDFHHASAFALSLATDQTACCHGKGS